MAGKRKTPAAVAEAPVDDGKKRSTKKKITDDVPQPPPTATKQHALSKVEQTYLKWMKAKGVKLHGVGIGRFQRTGRGCVALRDISPGDVIVEVPEDAIITADTSAAAAALEAFGIAGEAMEAEEESPRLEREALVLAVMAEMSRGASSTFAPYLAALPTLRATHSPLAWSGAELAELEGTSALDHMISVEDESIELPCMTADHWKHVAKPFLMANPKFACPPGRAAQARESSRPYLESAWFNLIKPKP